MSEDIIKLAAALPKGEGCNGFDDALLADDLWRTKVDGRVVQPRVAVIVYGVKEAKVDGKGDHVVTAEVLRVQNINTVEGRRAAETLLREEYVSEHGSILPYDVKRITEEAFADLPRSADETDEIEERERDTMSPADETRRHLERVHGREDAHLLSDDEAERRHQANHDGDMPDVLQHDREWIGWTRADIEAATAESDGDPHEHEQDADQLPLGEGIEPIEVTMDADTAAQVLGDGDRSVPTATFSGTAN